MRCLMDGCEEAPGKYLELRFTEVWGIDPGMITLWLCEPHFNIVCERMDRKTALVKDN